MPLTAQPPAPESKPRWTKPFAALGHASSETVDRILLGVCAVVWLAFVGVLVAAIVAMVGADEGSGWGSSWGIYIVIGVSLAVILGAIPLLWWARRTASRRPAKTGAQHGGQRPAVSTASPGPRQPEAATEKLRVFGDQVDPVSKASLAPDYSGPGSPAHRVAAAAAQKAVVIDRVWLRTTVGMASAIGLALLAVVTGTYLLAVNSDTGAVAAFVVAGLVTCAMGVIPWLSLRRLHELAADAGDAAGH